MFIPAHRANLITRMPKKELQAVLIKQQHNVASNGRDYPLKAAADHARVNGPVAKAALARSGGAGKTFVPETPAL